MSSISFGVAALVAIDSFSANTTRSIREQARAMMGGDISFAARGKFTDSVMTLFDSLRTHGTPIERVTTFASMASAPRSGGTRLAQVRAVSNAYPLYGAVVTKPAGRWSELARRTSALVDPALLIALNADVGDTIVLGFARFVIAGTVESIPGDPGVAAIVGPRVFISERWLDSTRLLTFGSRAEYEAVARVPEGIPPGRWVTPLRRRLERQQVRIRTVAESENNMTTAITQLAQFLGVVGLVALLLGGIGVASGVHAFVQRKIDIVAILRCVGATGWQVLGVYVVQAGVMGLVGAAAGALLGVAIQFALPHIMRDLLPVDVRVTLEPRAILMGLAIGAWVALIFALRPLIALRRVSPLATLRRDAETIGAARRRDALSWAVTASLALSVVALAYARADSTREGFVFTSGIAASLAVLAASAWLLTAIARKASRLRWPFVVRQGFANLHRPANQTQSVVIALGFGAFLVSTLYLVQANLLRQFDATVGASKGNVLFFDVQDDQRAGVDSLIRAGGNTLLESVPLVTMRISEINGKTTAAYARSAGLGQQFWALSREYRSTYRDTVVQTEDVYAGTWFGPPAPGDSVFEMSFERDVAENLKVTLGDTITWDVQGALVRTRITSLRDVNWGRFEPNFFAVFPPAALAGAPRQHIMVAAVSSDTAIARLQRQAVARYPNVASIDLSLIRGTILKIIARVASAVRFLALFSFAMGIPVLFSAVAATRRERLRESVLLKTLGATRRQIGRILFSEYAALGLLGALAGMLLSLGGAWALMKWVFDLPFSPALVPTFVIAATMTLMAIVIGGLTSREVFRATAMEALRE
jgi:putative ABC transport system permease protein